MADTVDSWLSNCDETNKHLKPIAGDLKTYLDRIVALGWGLDWA